MKSRRSPIGAALAVIVAATMLMAAPGSATADSETGSAQMDSAPYPDASTTGVPPGTELTPSGSLTIEEPGTVIDGLHITGTVVVLAADVTIKNSIIDGGTAAYPLRIRGAGSHVTVIDSEITGGTSSAVCCAQYTLLRVEIHEVHEGPRVGTGATIKDSYIHHLIRCPGCHVDALQSTGGSGIRVIHNNIQAYNPDADDRMNAAFQFGEESRELYDCIFAANLVNGGNYTINGGGGGTTGSECRFVHNAFGRDFAYGPAGNLGAGVDWLANVWHDTGELIPRP